MTEKDYQKEYREICNRELMNFWTLMEHKIDNEIKEINQKNTSVGKDNVELNTSFQELRDLIAQLAEYCAEGEEGKVKFNDIIFDLDQKVFHKLQESIRYQLEIRSQDLANHVFFKDFFLLVNYMQFKKRFPDGKCQYYKEVIQESGSRRNFKETFVINYGEYENTDFFVFNSTAYHKAEEILKILEQSAQSVEKGYPNIFSSLNYSRPFNFMSFVECVRFIRNIEYHRSSIEEGIPYPKDFIYQTKVYGNFFLACSIIKIALYAYQEILTRLKNIV